MLLLNVITYKLERFSDERSFPPYAILSHTWADGKEVQYGDILRYDTPERDEELDWKKIHYTCRQTIADGLLYAWIDTCCIDKSSSAELSEAINSMFRWYQKAKICYVYMSDVASSTQTSKENSEEQERSTLRTNFLTESDSDRWRLSVDWMVLSPTQKPDFRQSRWFTRGWTLQELLASSTVVFYDHNWTLLGDRIALVPDISAVTGIPSDILHGHTPLRNIGVAVRMSWASRRQTTRIEDEAYCLLGIFDIPMPLLYGEGCKAFLRLQEEILKVSGDQTIFAWNGPEFQLLAPSPAHFAESSTIVPRNFPRQGDGHEMTTRGCHISLPFVDHVDSDRPCLGILDCIDLRKPDVDVCLSLSLVGRRVTRSMLKLEPNAHTLEYVGAQQRQGRYQSRYRRRAGTETTILILRYAREEPAESSIIPVRLTLFSSLEQAPCQLFPKRDWNRETKCTDIDSDKFHDPRAVWIGSSGTSNSEFLDLRRRFIPSSNKRSGIIFAWEFSKADRTNIPTRVRIAYGTCSHDQQAPKVAKKLFNKLDTFLIWDSMDDDGNARVFVPRHLNNHRMLQNIATTFSWRGFTISFSSEPIGMYRDGAMVMIEREEKAKSRVWHLREQAARSWRIVYMLALCASDKLYNRFQVSNADQKSGEGTNEDGDVRLSEYASREDEDDRAIRAR